MANHGVIARTPEAYSTKPDHEAKQLGRLDDKPLVDEITAMDLKSYLPIAEWLPAYTRKDLGFDLIAGLTVGVMLVPQGMAYSLLAGMPPIYGLYAGIVPLIVYAIFGTSRHLSIGPVAVSALLVLAGISQLAEPGSERFVSLVILTGLLIGIVQLLLSLFRLGFLVNFLSHPVISGFTSAAAVIIAASQLQYLLGIEIPRFEHLYETVGYAFSHLHETNLPTLALGIGGIILMLVLKRLNKNIPGALVTVVLGIALTRLFQLQSFGVAIVGEIPAGVPHFSVPEISLENIKLVFPTVLTVTTIGIVESIGIAKALEAKHDYYKVRPNQELLALGLSKIFGAFFLSLPTSGSFTRSAVNNEVGGRTGISSIVTALVIILGLIFLMPLFYFLPEAMLASIVVLAVRSLFEFNEAVHLWKVHRTDFWMMMTTFLVTLALGIEEGVLAGVVLSVVAVIFQSSKPHIAVLGKLPQTSHYRNVNRFPEAQQFDDMLLVRFDAHLYYANSSYFVDQVTQLTKEKGESLKVLILDASSMHEVDSSGLSAIKEVHKYLRSKQIQFYFCGVIGPVRDLFHKADMLEQLGPLNHFMNLNDAVEHYRNQGNDSGDSWSKAAIQTNVEQE